MNENHYIRISRSATETSAIRAALEADPYTGTVEWFAHTATYEQGHAIGCKRATISIAKLQHANRIAAHISRAF